MWAFNGNGITRQFVVEERRSQAKKTVTISNSFHQIITTGNENHYSNSILKAEMFKFCCRSFTVLQLQNKLKKSCQKSNCQKVIEKTVANSQIRRKDF
jgi:hypothetical protein